MSVRQEADGVIRGFFSGCRQRGSSGARRQPIVDRWIAGATLRVLFGSPHSLSLAWMFSRRPTIAVRRTSGARRDNSRRRCCSCAVRRRDVARRSPRATQAIRRRRTRCVSVARDVRSGRAPDCGSLRCVLDRQARTNCPPCSRCRQCQASEPTRSRSVSLLNARFRLPAGEYALDLTGSDAAGLIPNAIDGPADWTRRPADRELAAGTRPRRSAAGASSMCRSTPSSSGSARRGRLEQTIAELRSCPLERGRDPQALPGRHGALGCGVRTGPFFFHDSNAYPEARGILGERTDDGADDAAEDTGKAIPDVLLPIHSGARPNVVTLATPGWSQKLELVPGVTQRVTVPSKEGDAFRAADDLERRRLRSRRDRTEPRSPAARRVDRVYPRRYRQNVRSPLTQSFAPIFFPSSRLRGKY